MLFRRYIFLISGGIPSVRRQFKDVPKRNCIPRTGYVHKAEKSVSHHISRTRAKRILDLALKESDPKLNSQRQKFEELDHIQPSRYNSPKYLSRTERIFSKLNLKK